jgi:hypothetical protein
MKFVYLFGVLLCGSLRYMPKNEIMHHVVTVELSEILSNCHMSYKGDKYKLHYTIPLNQREKG